MDHKVLDDGIADGLDGNEVVGFSDSSVRTQTVPPCLTVSVNDRALLGCEHDVGTSELDHIVVGIGVGKSCLASERHRRACLELGEIKSGVSGHSDTIQSDVGTGRDSSSDTGVRCDMTSISGSGNVRSWGSGSYCCQSGKGQ